MRVLLAGAQATGHFRDLLHVAKNYDGQLQLLMSYYYLRKMKKGKLEELLNKLRDVGAWCFLDSGAHTYFTYHDESLFHRKHIGSTAQGAREKDAGYVDPEHYVEEYTEWLTRYGDYFEAYAELDIGGIDAVGLGRVIEWRQMMLDRGLSRDKLVPVVHFTWDKYYAALEGKDPAKVSPGWRNSMFERVIQDLIDEGYTYIGFEGGWQTAEYEPLLKLCGRQNVRTHGFAMTRLDVFRDLSFYSVDSTSWLSGQQYGSTFIIEGEKMTVKDKKRKAEARNSPWVVEMCEKYEIDHAKLMEDDPYEVNRINAVAWCEFQHNMTWHHRNDPIVIARGEGPKVEAANMPAVREVNNSAVIGRVCDTCYIADKCPYMKPGSTCSVPFGKDITGGAPTIQTMVQNLIVKAYERLEFALGYETARGGLLDPNVSKEIGNFITLLERMKKLGQDDSESVTIVARGRQGTGVISQLFGGYGRQGAASPAAQVEEPRSKHKTVDDVIDVDPEGDPQ